MSNKTSSGFFHLPAYPWTGRQLFSSLRQRLAQEYSAPMSLSRLGQITGESVSTVSYWLGECEHRHLLGFMAMLERLSPTSRLEFVKSHCRTVPHLKHPLLLHSKLQFEKLSLLANKERGLTVITGGSIPQRTFLLTAYGHTFSGLNEKLTAVAGIDLTCQDNFVPVPNIKYLDRSIGIQRTQKLISHQWPKILTCKARLLLLNSVWSSFPECRQDILRLAESKHVILADDVTPSGYEIRPIKAPVHWLIISNGKNASGEIRINYRCKKS